ncbi:MAG: helix-turn-helix domain-containing protein, partial [Agrococcus casei]
MTDLPLLGQRIRHFRTKAKLTLDDVASQVGLAGSQLSLFENGRREPRLSQLDSIAAALGISSSDLLVREAPSERAS